MKAIKPVRMSPRQACFLGAMLLFSQAAVSASLDPSTGTLTLGGLAPQSNNLKFEVGPGAGQVRVTNNLNGTAQNFTGVSAINFIAGAGDDFLEFSIESPQSLALNLSTGAGPANVKINWKIPAGTPAAASSLVMQSGGGEVNVELDFESQSATSTFGWTTNFGGGNKLLKSRFSFKPGTLNATKNVNFANLGGGSHQVLMEVNSDAADARLALNAGAAQEVNYKVASAAPSTRLDVHTTSRGTQNNVDILSAAPDTRLSLRGGTSNSNAPETKYNVVQANGGRVAALLDYRMAGFGGKFESKFDGAPSLLVLSGRLIGTPGDDQIKIESTMPTQTSLTLNCGAGVDEASGPMPTAVNCESYTVR